MPIKAQKSVLVLDGHEEVRELLRDILEDRGYRVTEAATGGSALRHAAEHDFDLLITEFIMPIPRFRDLLPNLKIIATSGPEEVIFKKTAQYLGADHTLLKPFSVDEMADVIDGLMTDEPELTQAS